MLIRQVGASPWCLSLVLPTLEAARSVPVTNQWCERS